MGGLTARLDVFSDTARTLAGSVARDPLLAAIVLVVLIVVVVAWRARQPALWVGAVLLAGLALFLIALARPGAGAIPTSLVVVFAIIIVFVIFYLLVSSGRLATDVPWPRRRRLDEATASQICAAMDEILGKVGKTVKLRPGDLRANIFLPDQEGFLRIVPALTVHMTTPDERTMRIKIGTGVTGTAFAQGAPLSARFVPGGPRKDWPWLGLDPGEAAKVTTDLCWVIANPIPIVRPRLVFSVDGLKPTSEQRLNACTTQMLTWSGMLRLLLEEVQLPRP